MKVLSKKLCYLDIFGQNISLNLEGENKYRTATGGFITICIVFIALAYFESQIVAYINKNNVKAVQEIEFEDVPDIVYLTEDKFMFAVQIQQVNFTINPYFNITLKTTTQLNGNNGDQTKNTEYHNLIPCTLDRFTKVFQQYNYNFTEQYNQIGLSQWLCPTQGFNYSIGGRYTNSIFKYIKFEVSACQNGSSQPWSPTCAPPAQIEEYLAKNTKFELKLYKYNQYRYLTNQIVNADQAANYTQAFLDDELFFYFIPKSLGPAVDVFFRKYSIINDEKIFPLTGSTEYQTLYIKDQGDFVQRVWFGNPNDTIYASLFLRRSPYLVTANRSYQQFTDIMSTMGGFINVLVVIFGVIVGFYNTQQYRIKIANKVYNFDYERKNHQSETNADVVNQITNIKKKTMIQNSSIRTPLGSPVYGEGSALLPFMKSAFQQQQELIVQKLGFKSRKDYLSAQIQGILSRSRNLHIQLRFLINQLSCHKIFANDTKCQLFNRASKQIDQDLDIYIILEKIKEVNLLKELVLSPDQQILFNFAPKPLISVKEEMKVPTRSSITGVFQEETEDNQSRSLAGLGSIAKIAIKRQTRQKYRFHKDIKIFNNVYQAYERIISDKQSQINSILINKLGKEIKDIFEVSRFIDFDQTHLKISDKIQKQLRVIVRRVRQNVRKRIVNKIQEELQVKEEEQQNIEKDLEQEIFSYELDRGFEIDILHRNIKDHHK